MQTNQAIMCSILSPSLEVACALNVGITCVFCFGGIPPRLLFDSAKVIQWVSPLKYSYTVRPFVHVCVCPRVHVPLTAPYNIRPSTNAIHTIHILD